MTKFEDNQRDSWVAELVVKDYLERMGHTVLYAPERNQLKRSDRGYDLLLVRKSSPSLLVDVTRERQRRFWKCAEEYPYTEVIIKPVERFEGGRLLAPDLVYVVNTPYSHAAVIESDAESREGWITKFRMNPGLGYECDQYFCPVDKVLEWIDLRP